MDYIITSLKEQKENRLFYLKYLKDCDWKAGSVLAGLIESGEFFDKEDEILFLMDGNNVVSFLTLAHQDCIKDETLRPWIGFVYTYKKYRGRRCSEILIRHALDIARARGYAKVYLATGHIGLYEKYGFEYRENRTDIYGEESRIYFYNLNKLTG